MSDLSSIIESEVSKWQSAMVDPTVHEPADINNGHCKAFARGVKDVFPGRIRIRTYGYDAGGYVSHAHAWIEHNGRHYDAECPDGVDHPQNLPLFRRAGINPLAEDNGT